MSAAALAVLLGPAIAALTTVGVAAAYRGFQRNKRLEAGQPS